jgi:hypothetical protein
VCKIYFHSPIFEIYVFTNIVLERFFHNNVKELRPIAYKYIGDDRLMEPTIATRNMTFYDIFICDNVKFVKKITTFMMNFMRRFRSMTKENVRH